MSPGDNLSDDGQSDKDDVEIFQAALQGDLRSEGSESVNSTPGMLLPEIDPDVELGTNEIFVINTSWDDSTSEDFECACVD